MPPRRRVSMNGTLITYTFNPRYPLDLLRSLTSLETSLRRLIDEEIEHLEDSNENFKIQLCSTVEFVKTVYAEDGTSERRVVDHHFPTSSVAYNRFGYDRDIADLVQSLLERFDAFIREGSGYTLLAVRQLHLKLFRYKVLRGGRKGVGVLPPFIANKKACLNIEHSDRDFCFFYCCLAVVAGKTKNAGRKKQYKHLFPMLDRSGIQTPVKITDVPRFERQNTRFSVSIIGCEGKRFVPLYASQRKQAKYDVCLLLYAGHYYLIRSLSRLLRAQSAVTRKYHFCHFCLQSFWTPIKLKEHETLCRRELQCLRAGSGDTVFKNYRHLFRLPFVIYFDVECLVHNKEDDDDDDDESEHTPISVCCWTVSQHAEFATSPVTFTGEDCISRFLEHLLQEEGRLDAILANTNAPMRLNERDELRYANTQVCDICGVRVAGREKVRDHDHLDRRSSSNLRFIACSRCNLTYGAQQRKIPVVAHNSMKYDISFIIQHLPSVDNVHILSRNSERPLSLKWGLKLCFIDSINFLQGGLDALAGKLMKSDLLTFLQPLSGGDSIKEDLLLQKAAFPYDYLKDKSRLEDDALPPRDAFFNSLTDSDVDEDSYCKAHEIWTVFGCKTLKDYMEIYVTLDVLLLAAVFETYRRSTYKHFCLDPCHYVSTPSLCMDAMLRMTRVKLEQLSDTDMYLFFTKAIRGGYSGSALRHAKANNDTMKDDYDPTSPTSYILSLDANNLYGHSLSKPLPVRDFRWLSAAEIERLDIVNHPKDDPVGYFLEVSTHTHPVASN